jgi:hypothetical protein
VLIGVYPLCLFRIDRFHLPEVPGVELIHGGRALPFDGKVLTNQSTERTLCVGNFFAFHVRNTTDAPQSFELVVSGPTVDGPAEQHAHLVFGTFGMMVEAPGVPLDPADDDLGDYSLADGSGLP